MKEFTNPMRVFMEKLKVARNIKDEVMSNLKNLIYLDADKALDDFEWCLMVSFFDEIVKFSEALVFVLRIYDNVEYAPIIKLMLYSMYDNAKDSYDIDELNECINEIRDVLNHSMANSSGDIYNTTLYNMSVLYNLKYKYAKFEEDLKPRTILKLISKVLYPLALVDQGILVKYEDIDEILSNNQGV